MAGADPSAGERLQKVLARSGVASRRAAEEMIRAGRVRVGGQVVTQLGARVTPGRDAIEVDGRLLPAPERKRYLILNKPRGYVTTLHDPQGRPTVADLVAREKQRLFPVGRLDADTEGLLILTNDGALAHALTHPSRGVEKEYVVRVRGLPPERVLARLRHGVELDDGLTAPARVRLLGHNSQQASLALTIHEGRNRQVRRMLEAVGYPVLTLCRVRIGPLLLQRLPPGAYRELSGKEVAALWRAARGKERRQSATNEEQKQR